IGSKVAIKFHEKQDRAAAEKNIDEILGAEGLLEVKPRFLEIFQEDIYPTGAREASNNFLVVPFFYFTFITRSTIIYKWQVTNFHDWLGERRFSARRLGRDQEKITILVDMPWDNFS
ncbi:hypothetical protein ACJX0J_038908, partial [Zea mays]